jgi:uncharacterized protein (TIGR03437 family)
MKRLVATLLGTALLSTPHLVAQIEGEPPFEACKPGGFTVIGYPDEFGPQRIARFPVVIDNRFQGQFLTTQRIWLPAIQEAIEKWNNVSGATWKFDNQGLTQQDAMGIDGRVTISSCGFEFGCKEMVPVPPEAPPDPMLPPEVVPLTARQLALAVTLISADFSREKAILDADVFFNPEAPFQTDPNLGQIDFESVLVHELGHVVGLGHNDNCGANSTVMESFIDVGQRRRDLQGPETAGLKFLYPDDSTSAVSIYEQQRSLRFDAVEGKLPPFGKKITVYGARGGNWKAAVTTSGGGNWVVLDPPNGDFFTSGDVEVGVDSTGLAVGDYSATISFSAEGHAGPPATVAVALSVKPAVQGGQTPSLSTAGIVSSANFGAQAMAPGGLFTIFGSNLATTTEQASGAQLPTSLGGTEVVVNGRLAPLLYVSPGQINAQYPPDAEFGRGGVIVRTGLGQSLTIFMESTEAAPQLFTAGGRVIAVNQDGTLNSTSNAARGGSLVTVFLTGQGPVNPPVGSGQPAPSKPLAEVTLPVLAEIGGQQVEVQFLGLAPGFVGLAQGNLRVPTGLAGNLAVRLTIGGVVSNTGVLTVVE